MLPADDGTESRTESPLRGRRFIARTASDVRVLASATLMGVDRICGTLVSCVAVLLMWAAGCTTADRTPPVTVTRADWSFDGVPGRKLTTTHFDIYSTLTDAPFEKALPGFLEAAHRQYAALLPPSDTTDRLQTYVFANRRQWDAFTRRRFPQRYRVYRQIGSGGFANGNVCVAYYLRSRAPTLAVLAHEGMHQYFAHHFKGPLPAWINEGLACYCESYDLPGGTPRFTPRHNTFRINALREALALDALIPLDEMLATDAGKVIVNGQSRRIKTYYAQAWAMVLFCRDGGNDTYAAGFERMLGDITTGRLQRVARANQISSPGASQTSYGKAVFRAYITDDLPAFDKSFRAYIHRLAGFRAPADAP